METPEVVTNKQTVCTTILVVRSVTSLLHGDHHTLYGTRPLPRVEEKEAIITCSQLHNLQSLPEHKARTIIYILQMQPSSIMAISDYIL
jgi:hypothetical protein